MKKIREWFFTGSRSDKFLLGYLIVVALVLLWMFIG